MGHGTLAAIATTEKHGCFVKHSSPHSLTWTVVQGYSRLVYRVQRHGSKSLCTLSVC